VLVDLLTVYGEGGKAIVFTQTKREADEVAASVGGHLPCGALHGDMSQREREKVLNAFRANKVGACAAGCRCPVCLIASPVGPWPAVTIT
jgi:ATP-dependent RNA helicase DDX21